MASIRPAFLPCSIVLTALLALGVAPLLPAQSSASDCSPHWVATFGRPPGLSGIVRASLVHDDGSGLALYVAGEFGPAAGVPGTSFIARWNGSTWSSVGGGTDGAVRALAIYDDGQGGGPALYAGGSFAHAGGVEATDIAKWDGSTWSALDAGQGGISGAGAVNALAVYDDGNGAGLYVGGSFAVAGSQIVHGIARWDGLGWSSLGGGVDGPFEIDALAAHDDGQGGGLALYAGGTFNSIDGVVGPKIARWNGSLWSEVGGGVNADVLSLSVIDLGIVGPLLYAGGKFSAAGAVTARGIAVWDGEHWRQLGTGVTHALGNARVTTIGAYDDGSGPALYAGGHFNTAGGVTANSVAKWNGVAWSALDWGVVAEFDSLTNVYALTVFDAGDGPRLYAGGNFEMAGSAAAGNLASWDGAAWTGEGNVPLVGPNSYVNGTAIFDDGLGGGPVLVAGGWFTTAGEHVANHVAKWDATGWTPLGTGLDGPVWTLAGFDDGLGGGPALYAGGSFGPAESTHNIARWTGTDWVGVGGGTNFQVLALKVFDDGTGGGPELYAGGDFSSAGGVPGTQYIAKWDGVAWHSVSGMGMSEGYQFQGEHIWVESLAVFDDGSGGGPALYAGGLFNKAGGVPAASVAKWDGVSWSPLGSGLQGGGYRAVLDFEVFDDGLGGGPALYAGGYFQTAGGLPALNIARWSGSSWSPLGSGISDSPVADLQVHDDGSGDGPVLVVAGDFSSAGGVPANSLASWDGTSWSAYGEGVDGGVSDLCVFDFGGPTLDLIAAGNFVDAGGTGDSYIAHWSGCPVEPSPWNFVGYALSGVDGPPLLAGTGSLLTGTPGTLALTHAAPSAPAMLFVSLAGVSAPFKCGTLVPVPVNLQFLLFTNGAGSIPLGWAHWPGGISGLSLYFQYAVQDGAAICGVAMSNALRADIP